MPMMCRKNRKTSQLCVIALSYYHQIEVQKRIQNEAQVSKNRTLKVVKLKILISPTIFAYQRCLGFIRSHLFSDYSSTFAFILMQHSLLLFFPFYFLYSSVGISSLGELPSLTRLHLHSAPRITLPPQSVDKLQFYLNFKWMI